MACDSEENKTAVQDMVENDSVPDRTVRRALKDAERFVKKYDGQYVQDDYTILLRYYACHLLGIWGFAARVNSMSVGDVSETRKDLNLGDAVNITSYLVEFNKLLQTQVDEFFVSV